MLRRYIMNTSAINFDQFTIDQLLHIYADNDVKAKVYRGVKYTQDHPGTVAKISIPIIFAGGAAGAVTGFAVGGGLGTPIGIGVAVGAVVGVSGSIVYISHSSHYAKWKDQIITRYLQELENQSVPQFELISERERQSTEKSSDHLVNLLEQDGENLDDIIDPIDHTLIRLPVRGKDNILYDFYSIVAWIRTKPAGTAASILRICDFTEEELTFDFPAAEKIIRFIEQYRERHQNDKHRKITVRTLHLFERDLYERICSLWAAEIDKLKTCLENGTIDAERFTNSVERIRAVFRLDTIGELLADNPLVHRSVDEIMQEVTTGSSSNLESSSNSSQQANTGSSESSSSSAGPSQERLKNEKAPARR